MINTTCEISAYEEYTPLRIKPSESNVKIHRHKYYGEDLIVIEIDDKKVVVEVKELLTAIRSCTARSCH